jgi:signal transduction histidine kinase/ligand-binding sensor domain-containing protein
MRIDLHGLLVAAALLGLLPGAATPAAARMEDGRFSIDTWGAGQGLLPDDSVLALTQTHDGYLWAGTLYGLVRFDGVRFTVFDESNTPKLPSIRIVRLFEDSHSNLWIGTSTAGAAVIQQGRVKPLGSIGRGRRKGHLASICEDSTGAVWLLTEDGQLGRYANGQMDVWNLGGASGQSVIADKSGTVWIGAGSQILGLDPAAVRSGAPLPTTDGPPVAKQLDLLLASQSGGYWCLADGLIRKYSGTRLEKDFGPYPWPVVAGSGTVTAACEDRDGHLIVGTGGLYGHGVFWFDAQGRFARICTTNGLTNDSVYALQPDADGNLWVGLVGPKGGLNRVRPKVFKLLEETYGSIVQSLCPDDQGGLWISAKDKDFSYLKNGVLRPIHSHALPMSLLNPTAILVDRSQRVWAAARPALGAGLFRLEEGAFLLVTDIATPPISVLFADHSDSLWVGTEGGLGRWNGTQVEMFTTSNGLSANNVRAIAQDRAGDLWIGTELGGLNRLRHGQFSSFQQTNGFPSDNISSLYVDGADVLWVGTIGNGLIRLKDGKTTHFCTTNGLIANSIDFLIEDDHGNLWMGSNLGLMRVRKMDLNDYAAGAASFVSCRAYDQRDGLPSAECASGSQPAVCRASDGALWFPTVAGVVHANPAHIHSNSNPPPVVIEQVLVEGNPQNTSGPHAAPPSSVTLPPGREQLEIHYTSLNLGAADRARFRYRLQAHGRDSKTNWDQAGNLRFARYQALRPGSYTFQVCACNEDGVWNESGASLAVTVLPFFWQTRSFLALAAAVLLGALAAAVYYFSTQKLQRQLTAFRQQQALEKERARIARDIHDQLGASLTQLALLGEMVEADTDSPQEAQAHARQISHSARETTRALDEIVWTVNPSNDTVDGLVNYICKNAQDYLALAGLRYRLDVPAQLPKTAISPEARHNVFLAAKEAVTNIVKHARASEASIRLRLEPQSFTLEIEDNGRGPDGAKEKAAESRNGLRNMRKRMEDIGGRFSFGPGPRGGTRVALTVPLAKD